MRNVIVSLSLADHEVGEVSDIATWLDVLLSRSLGRTVTSTVWASPDAFIADNTWTYGDTIEAEAQGWQVVPDGIVSLDFAGRFASDEEALAHVMSRASEGYELESRALAFLGLDAPLTIEASSADDALNVALLKDNTVHEVVSVTTVPTYVFTVFCQQSDCRGTTWIGHVEIEDNDIALAKDAGRRACANDWGGEWGLLANLDLIHVLGVAKGNVVIEEWNDFAE